MGISEINNNDTDKKDHGLKASKRRAFNIGGGWGDSITWSRRSQFPEIDENKEYDVHGWKTPKPKVGDVLKGEFVDYWMWFVFTEVRSYRDPADMFCGKVKPTRQEKK